jgi:hypothetical protein
MGLIASIRAANNGWICRTIKRARSFDRQVASIGCARELHFPDRRARCDVNDGSVSRIYIFQNEFINLVAKLEIDLKVNADNSEAQARHIHRRN